MDYNSMHNGAYHTRMDETEIKNDLKEMKPKQYQNSEIPANDMSLMKMKTNDIKNIEIESGTKENEEVNELANST
jgi:hypothetical protein